MSYVKWKIERTPVDDTGGWSGSPIEITSFHTVQIIAETGANKDSFSFNITNFNNEFNNYFNPNDKITIYRGINKTVLDSNDIIMIGTVKDTPETQDGTNNNLKITGYNFSETIMGAIIFAPVQNLTINAAIKLGIDNAREKNPNFGTVWKNTNPIVRTNGSAFPTVTEEKWYNKSLRKYIEDYSRNARTGDGTYLWYVNNINEFVWKAKSTSIDYEFDAGVDAHTSIRVSRDIKGIVNFIVLKGGLDPSGRQIQTRYIDQESISKNGTKYYFLISSVNAAKNFVDQDIINSYGTDSTPDGYPYITSASFTTIWKVPNLLTTTITTNKYGISIVPGSTVTINEGSEASNKKAYSEVIREMVKGLIYAEGQEFSYSRRNGKLRVDVEVISGSKTWGLGDVISCTIPIIDSSARSLRVKTMQLGSDQDIYSLEEDKGTL